MLQAIPEEAVAGPQSALSTQDYREADVRARARPLPDVSRQAAELQQLLQQQLEQEDEDDEAAEAGKTAGSLAALPVDTFRYIPIRPAFG